ncbi:MAG TPA: MlaD family protein, partial [Verrucomicrobiae bacterium]|nr:MlaD family protein [Verrucomicrobiae bacterium]
DVTVELEKSAASVARRGSRFWIVQPRVGVEQITGLRTIVSGNYITVEPGAGPEQTRFDGLAEEPVLEAKSALRVVLLAEKMGSMKKRSPVYFRGMQVGQIFDCELDTNAQTVRVVADVDPRYAPLVRMNSKFWNAGGINVNIGLSGADITAQSAQALLSGGVEFATPDSSEKQAAPGTTFRLYDKPQDQWLAWSPAIHINAQPPPPAPTQTAASK